MSESDLSARVVALVARVSVAEPKAEDRLLQDLGIDGDDADELFQIFERDFGVDLTNLYARWDQHFRPEGIPLTIGLSLVVLTFIAGLPWIWLGAPQWFCIVAGLVGGCLLLVGLRKIFPDRQRRPITVADMIQAAEVGHWSVFTAAET